MPNIYSTMQGDTWDIVSLRAYGTEKKMGELITANPNHRETVFFAANIRLIIPDLPAPIKSNLPPWKRGD